MSNKVLGHIEDFFGPLNLDTISQAIHFARYQVITNASGRNTFVNRENLRRWTPIQHTLSIHVEKNELADPETLNLMEDLMQEAGLPFTKRLIKNMGHQDSLIGIRNTEMFAVVEDFLVENNNASFAPSATHLPTFLPWVGPRQDSSLAAPNNYMLMCDPAYGDAFGCCVPVVTANGGYVPAPGLTTLTVTEQFKPGKWMHIPVPSATPTSVGWLFILCYLRKPSLGDLDDMFADLRRRYTREEMALAFIDNSKMNLNPNKVPDQLTFAFASCHYPAGIVDRPMAERTLFKLAQRLTSAEERPELLLLLGDQIYADASAGLLDPTRTDERFQRPHEDWLRMEPLRRIMREIPVYCMLDDHEIRDNWHRKPNAGYDWALSHGRAAYVKYQRPDLPKGAIQLWRSFDHADISFFMTDTRTERTARTHQVASPAIMSPEQMSELKKWLTAPERADRPKIISSASMLLPKCRVHTEDILSIDAWEAYPESLNQLLHFIYTERLKHVVFLSGDEHLSLATAITLSDSTAAYTVTVHSIHCSGLYAPLPVANALPASFPPSENFPVTRMGVQPSVHCMTETTVFNCGDAYAMVSISKSANAWQLDLNIHGKHSSHSITYMLE